MLSIRTLSVFLVALAMICLTAVNGNFVTMRQDSSRNGYFDLIDSVTGEVLRHSSEAPIIFGWPYCEMTSDQAGQRVFATIFPDNSNNSVLYQLDSSLNFEHIYPNTDYWFFDLQYSPKQQTLYGIKVTSTYGRVISNFALPAVDTDPLVATELITMPYMWYVNASTFDDENSRYFSLLNYFPGHPESVLDQKLVVASMDYTRVPTDYAILDMASASSKHGIVQFITFSKRTQQLYFASVTQDLSTVYVGILSQKTAEIKLILARFSAFSVGPLTVDDHEGILTVFIKPEQGAAWTLYEVKLDRVSPTRAVKTYNHDMFTVFDGVARF